MSNNNVHSLSHRSQFICLESPTEQIIGDIGDIMLATGCNAAPHDLLSKVAPQFEEKIT